MPRPHIFRLSGLRGCGSKMLGATPFFGGMSPLPAYQSLPLVSDTFTRSDSSSLGVADTGQTWVALLGTWGIQSNQAYLVTDAGDSQCIAYLNTGQTDGTISITLATVGTNSDTGLAFRITDANNYYLAIWTQASTELRVFRRAGGTFTQLGSSVSYTASNGDVLSVDMAGSNFDFKVNGVSKIAVSDATHSTTNHGLRVFGASDFVTRLDNFGLSQAGAISLVIQNAAHSHSAGSLTLTQVHNLTVANAAHTHTAGNLTLTQAHQLVVANASHAHTANNLTLTQTHVLAVQSASHGHTAGNLVLSTVGTLGIANATHAHTASNLALTQVHSLVTQNALHGHTAGSLTLTLSYNLSVQTALHSNTVASLGLTQAHNLQASSAFHVHVAQDLELEFGGDLQISDSVHAHTARNISFAWTLPADVLTVAAESRMVTVSGETRSIVIPAQAPLVVGAESRVLTVPAEDRIAR